MGFWDGHVEGGEAGVGVGGHGVGGALRVEGGAVLLEVGDLPHAGEGARDGEAGGERDAVDVGGGGHGGAPGATANVRRGGVPTVYHPPRAAAHAPVPGGSVYARAS